MLMEEYIEDGELVIRAEIPGIDPQEDLEVTLSHGVLHIEAERHDKMEQETDEGFRSEFRYGSMVRSVRLPTGVSEDEIRATYHHGILEVRAPMESEPDTGVRKIPVNDD